MAATASAQSANISILSILAAPFVAIGNFLVVIAESSERMRQVEKLNAMSDEELAELGLTREEAARRIFSDVMGI